MTGRPKYENLTNKTTLEYGMMQELTNIQKTLEDTAKKVSELNIKCVNQIQRNELTWEKLAEELERLHTLLEQRTSYILEKFD